VNADVEWSRPHPLSVVVMVATFLAGNAWPIIVILVAGGGGIGFDNIAVLVGAATVGWGALGWYMTGYAVTTDAVRYRSGILNRQARSIPLDRIQQVSVAEPVLARIVGLAVVQVAEASADGDIEIRYLGLPAAQALTERLRHHARRTDDDVNAGSDKATAGSVLPRPPPRPATRLHTGRIGDLLTYQMASLAPGLAVLMTAALVPAVIVAVELSRGAGAVIVVVGIVAAVVLAAITIAGAMLQFGNFTLDRGARSLTIDTGLLSRRQVEVRPDRIQTLTVTSGPVARRIGLHEIRFSAAIGKATKQQQSMVHIAPAVRTDEIPLLVQGSVDVDAGLGVALEPVNPVTVHRALVRAGIVYLFLIAPPSIIVLPDFPYIAVIAATVWWGVAVWFARARYRRLGISLDGDRLVLRRGVLQHHLTQIPLVNVQSVSTTASWFQRRLGVADLRVSTAGIGPDHFAVVPDLSAGRADELARILGASASDTPWELRD
jgi:putative membrane protein